MKGTDHFKKTIQMYLEQRAEEDQLFAKSFSNPAKNIDDCVTYILNYVKNSGCNGFTDGEIFGQAIHYYEENEIEVGKPMNCQVAVNHIVELTAEEKAEARQKAIQKYQEEEVRKLQNRNRPAAEKKKLLYNPPYLTFDYETQDTHTKKRWQDFPPTFTPYPQHKLIGHTAIVLNISATAPRKETSLVPTAVTSGTATADYVIALMVVPAPNAMQNSKCETPESAPTRKRGISA